MGNNENVEKKEKGKMSIVGTIISALLFVGMVFLYFWWNQGAADKEIEQYAKQQLELQKYTVIEVKALESHAYKNGNNTGKIEFVVKNPDGQVLKGNANVESEGTFTPERVFKINEIKPQN